jgi:hypothetical protein
VTKGAKELEQMEVDERVTQRVTRAFFVICVLLFVLLMYVGFLPRANP